MSQRSSVPHSLLLSCIASPSIPISSELCPTTQAPTGSDSSDTFCCLGSVALKSETVMTTTSSSQAAAPTCNEDPPFEVPGTSDTAANADTSATDSQANHQKKGYMAVTAHYIDDKWEPKSFLLRFIYVPAPHTAEVIADVLHEVLVDFHLERKVSTVTLDNCSTNDSVMVRMQDKLPLDTLMLDGSFLHMRCAAHILNLIVKDGMSILEKGIEKIRDSVGFWSATPKRHERFEKMASQLNIAYKKRIGLDCCTRWNSTYIMLSTALEYQPVFERLALREKLFSPICPNGNEWLFAKEVCSRLKLFFDISELLSGTKYVTANLFFPKICSVYLSIRKWRSSGHPRIEDMSHLMKDKFDKYWKDVHGLMAVAVVLDPRYKLHMLTAFFTSVYGLDHATAEVNKVRDLLYQLVVQYQNAAENMATSDTTHSGNTSAGHFNVEDDELFDIFDQYMSSQPAAASYVRTELDLYLEEPPLPRTQEFDIVSWWKFGGIKYPTLQNIARDILAIPVTTVASESAFSTSGRVISPSRSSLVPKIIEALMCMQAWSRADMLGAPDSRSRTTALMTCNEEEEEEMDKTDSTIID